MKKLFIFLLIPLLACVAYSQEGTGPIVIDLTAPTVGGVPAGYTLYQDCDATAIEIGEVAEGVQTVTATITSLSTETFCAEAYVLDASNNIVAGPLSNIASVPIPELIGPPGAPSITVTFDCAILENDGTTDLRCVQQ